MTHVDEVAARCKAWLIENDRDCPDDPGLVDVAAAGMLTAAVLIRSLANRLAKHSAEMGLDVEIPATLLGFSQEIKDLTWLQPEGETESDG